MPSPRAWTHDDATRVGPDDGFDVEDDVQSVAANFVASFVEFDDPDLRLGVAYDTGLTSA